MPAVRRKSEIERRPTPALLNCAGCDNCLAPRATWDGTLAAQKFLSCVYRIREKSGFGVGIQHVVEVLCGADTEKIRKFGHQSLSTYNIGGEHTRAEWGAIGRELVRLGLLFQNAEKFNIVELTDAGRAALKSRRKITLTKPVAPTQPEQHRAGEIACDEALFEKLRALRKQLADERAVPPYIIFSDVSLRQMARFYPANEQRFFAHQRRRRKETARVWRHFPARNRGAFADERAPDFCRRFLHQRPAAAVRAGAARSRCLTPCAKRCIFSARARRCPKFPASAA